MGTQDSKYGLLYVERQWRVEARRVCLNSVVPPCFYTTEFRHTLLASTHHWAITGMLHSSINFSKLWDFWLAFN